MIDINDSSNSSKIANLQNSKGVQLWRIHFMVVMSKNGVLGELTEDATEDIASNAAKNRIKKMDYKARTHIVLIFGEDLAIMVTSLLKPGATTSGVWNKLKDRYHMENVQSKQNLRTKLHTIWFGQKKNIATWLV